LRYLAGTVNQGIGYRRDASPQMTHMPANAYPPNYPILDGYCDADHAGDEETRISVSGILLYMSGGPIHWLSRRQDVVSISSLESEYYAGSVCACEVEYFRHLLARLGVPQTSATCIGEDNIACVYVQSKQYGALKRCKHIDTRVHRLRQLYDLGVVRLVKIPTADQRADPMTKALGVRLHTTHTAHMLTTLSSRA